MSIAHSGIWLFNNGARRSMPRLKVGKELNRKARLEVPLLRLLRLLPLRHRQNGQRRRALTFPKGARLNLPEPHIGNEMKFDPKGSSPRFYRTKSPRSFFIFDILRPCQYSSPARLFPLSISTFLSLFIIQGAIYSDSSFTSSLPFFFFSFSFRKTRLRRFPHLYPHSSFNMSHSTHTKIPSTAHIHQPRLAVRSNQQSKLHHLQTFDHLQGISVIFSPG